MCNKYNNILAKYEFQINYSVLKEHHLQLKLCKTSRDLFLHSQKTIVSPPSLPPTCPPA